MQRPRYRRLAAGAVAASVVLAVAGCGFVRRALSEERAPATPVLDPVTGEDVAPTAIGAFGRPLGAAVLVRFEPMRAVQLARRHEGEVEQRVVTEVRALTGRLRASRGDTLYLAVTSVSDSHGRSNYPLTESRIWWARVSRGPGVRLELLSRSPTRTEHVTNAVVIGTVWAALGTAIYCVATRC